MSAVCSVYSADGEDRFFHHSCSGEPFRGLKRAYRSIRRRASAAVSSVALQPSTQSLTISAVVIVVMLSAFAKRIAFRSSVATVQLRHFANARQIASPSSTAAANRTKCSASTSFSISHLWSSPSASASVRSMPSGTRAVWSWSSSFRTKSDSSVTRIGTRSLLPMPEECQGNSRKRRG